MTVLASQAGKLPTHLPKEPQRECDEQKKQKLESEFNPHENLDLSVEHEGGRHDLPKEYPAAGRLALRVDKPLGLNRAVEIVAIQ